MIKFSYWSIFSSLIFYVNLKEYGLDAKITLSPKVKMYKNLINDINVNEEYRNNIEQCIYEHLLSRPLFKTK